jgi:hypothetical protein
LGFPTGWSSYPHHRPPGHKAIKSDIARQAGSLAFHETFKELMTKKEEAIAEREERQRRYKEDITKSFVDLQERSVTADEAIPKARLLEADTSITYL